MAAGVKAMIVGHRQMQKIVTGVERVRGQSGVDSRGYAPITNSRGQGASTRRAGWRCGLESQRPRLPGRQRRLDRCRFAARRGGGFGDTVLRTRDVVFEVLLSGPAVNSCAT